VGEEQNTGLRLSITDGYVVIEVALVTPRLEEVLSAKAYGEVSCGVPVLELAINTRVERRDVDVGQRPPNPV
jgi:hypothetical protein